MTIIPTLFAATMFAVLLLDATKHVLAGRHNVLFVVVDDLPTHIAPYLDPSHPLASPSLNGVYTPTLSKLAKESIIFHRAYVQNAACNPSRASFLTSRTPIELQLFTKFPFKNLPNAPLTMPNAFRKTHYVVGAGKVFHNDFAKQFDRFVSTGTGDLACEKKQQPCVLRESDLVDFAVTSSILQLIEKAPRSKPWFAFAGFHRPHWMYSTSASALDVTKTANAEITKQTLAASKDGALYGPNEKNESPYFASAVTKETRDAKPVSVSQASNNRQAVFASTQWMDTCLSNLLNGLEKWQSDVIQNTIVILVGDNGVMLFDRSQSGKSVLFNSAKRVPLMIRHPDFKQSWGKTTSSPTELMDLFPTLVESEDYPQKLPGLSGTSLMPLIRLLNNRNDYNAALKLGAITIETRCTVANPSILRTVSMTSPFMGDWIACHQLNQAPANRVDMFGIAIQTQNWNYIEWRVAQTSGQKTRIPRWDTGGLWGRELYNFADDDGLTRINGVEFERVNLAPCPKSCFPRNLNFPKSTNDADDNVYSLPSDPKGINFDSPDLDQVNEKYRDVVRRLSLVLRSMVRDKKPVCSGHGTANPISGKCDQCVDGWEGPNCEQARFSEFASAP